jgi:hypothetical protein
VTRQDRNDGIVNAARWLGAIGLIAVSVIVLAPGAAAAQPAGDPDAGQDVYAANCAMCPGADATGMMGCTRQRPTRRRLSSMPSCRVHRPRNAARRAAAAPLQGDGVAEPLELVDQSLGLLLGRVAALVLACRSARVMRNIARPENQTGAVPPEYRPGRWGTSNHA